MGPEPNLNVPTVPESVCLANPRFIQNCLLCKYYRVRENAWFCGLSCNLPPFEKFSGVTLDTGHFCAIGGYLELKFQNLIVCDSFDEPEADKL